MRFARSMKNGLAVPALGLKLGRTASTFRDSPRGRRVESKKSGALLLVETVFVN